MKERPLVPNLLKREEAKARGLTKYFTGVPCVHGHVAERWTSGGGCDVCRKLRQNSPEGIAYRNKRNAERDPTYRPEYYLKNKVHLDAMNKERRYRVPWEGLISSAKKRAYKTGKEFSLTQEWGKKTWTGVCALTGVAFEFGRGGQVPKSPSIDRIDNSKGYTPENCRFILQAINAFKSTMSDEEMLDMARALLENK